MLERMKVSISVQILRTQIPHSPREGECLLTESLGLLTMGTSNTLGNYLIPLSYEFCPEVFLRLKFFLGSPIPMLHSVKTGNKVMTRNVNIRTHEIVML